MEKEKVISLLLLQGISFSQEPYFLWAENIGAVGGGSNDDGISVKYDAEGNVYASGYSTGKVGQPKLSGTFKHTLSTLRHLLFLTSFLLVNHHSVGQTPLYKHFGLEDGVLGQEVYYCMEDSKGRIWFGTDKGVCYYNGYDITSLTSDDGLPDNTIFEIVEDEKQRIWFISLSMRLAYYKNNQLYRYRYNNVIQDHIELTSMYSGGSFKCENEQVSFAVSHIGELQIDENGRCESGILPGSPKEGKGAYLIDRSDRQYFFRIGMNYNLNYISEIENQCYPNFFSAIITNTDVMRITKIGTDIWFTKGEFLFVYGRKEPVMKFDKDILFIKEWNGKLCVSVRFEGVRVYQVDQEAIRQVSSYLPDYSVSQFIQDSEGGMWFTTLVNGIFYAPQMDVQVIPGTENNSFKQLSYSNSMDAIAALDDHGGVHIFSGNFKEKKRFEFPLLNSIEWEGNTIFLCWRDGLSRINWQAPPRLDIASTEKLGGLGAKSTQIHKNWVYVTSKRNIWKYNLLSGEIQQNLLPIKGLRIEDVCVSNGGIWVGSTKGLYKLEGKNLINYAEKFSVLAQRITCVSEYKGTVYIGTRQRGVFMLRGNNLIQLDRTDGLQSNIVTAIKITNNYLWILTELGISRVNLSNYYCESLSRSRTFANHRLNDFEFYKNNLLVATDKGIVLFPLVLFEKPIFQRGIYFDDIQLGSNSIGTTSGNTIKYEEASLKICFNGAPLSGSANLRYKYRLVKEGEVGVFWNRTTKRFVEYDKIEPGNYTFEVTADVSKYPFKAAQFEFEVLTPFWKAGWFFILLILLALVVITVIFAIVYRYRIRATVRHQELLYQVYHYKQLALGRQINPHFIFNSINSVQLFILKNDKVRSSNYLSNFAKLMRKMLDHCQENLVSVEKELNVLHDYMEIEAARFEDKFSWEIVTPDHNILTMKIPPAILQPLVENAIWHGLIPKESDRQLVVDFVRRDNNIYCRVKDNGIGRERSAELKKNMTQTGASKGNRIIQERLETINAYYGTTFHFFVEDDPGHENGHFTTIAHIKLSLIHE